MTAPHSLICDSCHTIYVLSGRTFDNFVEYKARRLLSINLDCIDDVLKMRNLKPFNRTPKETKSNER